MEIPYHLRRCFFCGKQRSKQGTNPGSYNADRPMYVCLECRRDPRRNRIYAKETMRLTVRRRKTLPCP